DMEFEFVQSNTTAKLPILKLAQENGTSVTKMSIPVTAEEKTNKKNNAHCKYHQSERVVYGNNYNKVYYNYTTNMTHPNAQRNMVPRAVLMKTGLKSFNTAKAQAVNTARPKAIKTARPNSVIVNAVRVNQENVVKASACWV
ncbi:hypothetical protein Tco_0049615, partial [Tanacetum coccineum]